MPTIALVDDDFSILTSTSIALETEGHQVVTYRDGNLALQGMTAHPPELVILDIKMPRMDGLELLRRLRRSSDVPVILLTSKNDALDEIVGLKIGADDFMRKPFSQRVLAERIKAILRRSGPSLVEAKGAPEGAAPRKNLIERGPLIIDCERHTCVWKGIAIRLTVTEFAILKALVVRPGIVKDRNALMDAAYGLDECVDDRTIDSHLKRVRKKFRAVENEFDAIETLYGVGYKWREDSADGAASPAV